MGVVLEDDAEVLGGLVVPALGIEVEGGARRLAHVTPADTGVGHAPGLYFHVTTAYAILRHNGLEIGKADYLGAR